MKKNILITGGSGLIGTGIQKYVKKNKTNDNFIFLSSNDCDLKNIDETRKIFNLYSPTHVVHLAANVGGLYLNMRCPVELYRENIIMNDNVMELCKEFKVEKLISCLSTCIFPDKTIYPIDENMIHLGPPHSSNEGYAYAKRMVDIANRSYYKEYGCNFTSIIPTNVYGINDNFKLEDAHVIPSLIHKAYIAKKNDANFVIYGSGKPLRQFIFSEDLAELIIYILYNYDLPDPIILSVDEDEEVSIKDVVTLISDFFSIDKTKIIFDISKSDGQYKKTASNKKLRSLLPDYKFKLLKDGIHETCKWFEDNYEICRK